MVYNTCLYGEKYKYICKIIIVEQIEGIKINGKLQMWHFADHIAVFKKNANRNEW